MAAAALGTAGYPISSWTLLLLHQDFSTRLVVVRQGLSRPSYQKGRVEWGFVMRPVGNSAE